MAAGTGSHGRLSTAPLLRQCGEVGCYEPKSREDEDSPEATKG